MKIFVSLIFFLLFKSLIINSEKFKTTFKVKLNENGQYVDNYGRIRIFHGFNSVSKSYPWYDKQILNITRLKLFKEWGMNIVRLGTMWSGVQPSEKFYNETYLGILKEIVNKLDQHGIYSLMDMHQDVFSSKFKAYDGIPLWLYEKFPALPNIYKFPFPLSPNKSYDWATYYLTFAASDAYQHLYKSDIGISSFVMFWSKIAQTFKNHSSIIGYELINEPWLGNFYEDFELLMPGYAGRNNLLPLYDKLVENIRKFDNDTLIFYEPVTFGAYLTTTSDMGTGFDRVPGGDSQRTKSVLSYHYYCFFLNSIDPAKNYSALLQFFCDKILAKSLFQSAITNIKKTGGGSMLTEFGLCIPDENPYSINTLECEAVLQMADAHFQSYTYWDSIFFDNEGQVLPMVVKTFSRVYPRALQGQPTYYSFNKTNKIFKLSYEINLNVSAPTEIFVPITVHYSGGFYNKTTPTMITSFDGDNFIFSVSPTKGIIQNSMITVTIGPISL